MTAGQRGAYLATSGEVRHMPAVPVRPEEIVDTAGAGDAFLTALAVAIANGAPTEDAIAVGLDAAARIIKGPGFVEALERWDGLRIGGTGRLR
jgi:sugar/nucleoside kinase (ribokinase family)